METKIPKKIFQQLLLFERKKTKSTLQTDMSLKQTLKEKLHMKF